MLENDLFYKNMFRYELGNLDKVYGFLQRVAEKIHLFKNAEFNAPIGCNLNLEDGNEIIISNRQSFYSIKGAVLADLFDDWAELHKTVESYIGPSMTDIPVISFSNQHIQRHMDIRRAAAVNLSLWNTESSTMCFWRGHDLVKQFRYDIGETVLINVKEDHSVILNDVNLNFTPRAVLMWSSETPYFDLLSRINEKAITDDKRSRSAIYPEL